MEPLGLAATLTARVGPGASPGERSPAVAIIGAIKAMPYGRASDREPSTVLREWTGTCSGKHYLLRAALEELSVPVRIVHRVFRLERTQAERLFPAAAAAVPDAGLTDVHTYALVELAGVTRVIDVTFPGPWDGETDIALACGDGVDVIVPDGSDAQALKDELIAEHCTPAIREPFIAALSRMTALRG
ncbi:MAG: hypothetical protein AB7O24_33530 [Kofleriaceae bacterium]